MVSRGASRAVMRVLAGDGRRDTEAPVKCPVCGDYLDFTRPDPLGLGRSMQGCENPRWPEHATRPLIVRHV